MSQESILVVDDEALVTKAIVDTVQSLGHSCQTALDGSNALNLIRTNDFDIIISDIRMPGLDGFELMEKAREIEPGISFIITTGHINDYQYDRVIGQGADDFIKKPFSEKEIKTKVDRISRERRLALENRHLLDEQLALNKKMSDFLETSRSLIAELNFNTLFKTIITKTTKLMEAERSSLYIIDWERSEIWTKVAEDVDEIRLPLGKGISGRVAETGETINVEEASKLPFFRPEFDIQNNFHTSSVLCMPVHNRKKERIGVLQVINKKNSHGFNQNDEMILKAIASHVGIAFENSFLLDELQLSFESSIRTLSATVDARHPLTAGHSQRVTEYCLMIAREMNLDDEALKTIKYAALLHDIGKIGIPDSVLLKEGPLTSAEQAKINTHPVRTRNILENFHFPKALVHVPVIASQHHEKVNGKGYPEGLTGDELSLSSKILAVADVFDALTSRRDYPKYCEDKKLGYNALPLPKVIEILQEGVGTHFDPDVIEAFLRCLPQALVLYRETHFPAEYVDKTIRSLNTTTVFSRGPQR